MPTSPRCTSPRHKCVSPECGQEGKTGDGHGQSRGAPGDAPPHRRFSAQTSTQISIHSPGAGSITDRGERRVRKNEKRQSRSDCLAPQAFVTFAPERGQKELLLRGERGQKEKVRCINRSESANRSMSHSLWAQ